MVSSKIQRMSFRSWPGGGKVLRQNFAMGPMLLPDKAGRTWHKKEAYTMGPATTITAMLVSGAAITRVIAKISDRSKNARHGTYFLSRERRRDGYHVKRKKDEVAMGFVLAMFNLLVQLSTFTIVLCPVSLTILRSIGSG
jgi:hypothetical protein